MPSARGPGVDRRAEGGPGRACSRRCCRRPPAAHWSCCCCFRSRRARCRRWRSTPGAMRNVYEQQYQMARFFRVAYPGDTIALNDIGAVAWLSSSRHRRHLRAGDAGGGRPETAPSVERGQPRGAHRAPAGPGDRDLRPGLRADHPGVVDPRRDTGRSPATWGSLTIRSGSLRRTPGDVDRLRSALDAFAPKLPATVHYTAVGN